MRRGRPLSKALREDNVTLGLRLDWLGSAVLGDALKSRGDFNVPQLRTRRGAATSRPKAIGKWRERRHGVGRLAISTYNVIYYTILCYTILCYNNDSNNNNNDNNDKGQTSRGPRRHQGAGGWCRTEVPEGSRAPESREGGRVLLTEMPLPRMARQATVRRISIGG